MEPEDASQDQDLPPAPAEPAARPGSTGPAGFAGLIGWLAATFPREPKTSPRSLFKALPDESGRAWGERIKQWRRDNLGYVIAQRTTVWFRLMLCLGVLFGALLTANVGLDIERPGGPGLGEAINLPYKDSYRRRFPDCVPFEPGLEKRSKSLLVVVLDGSARRMTMTEFQARIRARNRALAEVWVVGECRKKLPPFDASTIRPLTGDDVRRWNGFDPTDPATGSSSLFSGRDLSPEEAALLEPWITTPVPERSDSAPRTE